MSLIEISWLPKARELGHTSERSMLQAMYEHEGYSIKEISKILGVSTWSVRRRLRAHGVKIKARGGPHRVGMRKLLMVANESLFGEDASVLALEFQCHETTVYTERRLRRTEGYDYAKN